MKGNNREFQNGKSLVTLNVATATILTALRLNRCNHCDIEAEGDESCVVSFSDQRGECRFSVFANELRATTAYRMLEMNMRQVPFDTVGWVYDCRCHILRHSNFQGDIRKKNKIISGTK